MKNSKSYIELSNVTKSYQSGEVTNTVLSDISLEINKKDFIAIIGPSGSGKSTLMNMIGLLDTPTSGKIFLKTKNLLNLSEDDLALLRNREIGFIFQSFNLLPRASTIENVMLPSVYAGIAKNERVKKATNLLTTVGLADKLQSRPNQLSGGQQQRVAIARALINDPQLILADEPTGNLDTKSGMEIMKILSKLHKEGRTIVMITHEKEIAAFASRVIKIRDGKIIN